MIEYQAFHHSSFASLKVHVLASTGHTHVPEQACPQHNISHAYTTYLFHATLHITHLHTQTGRQTWSYHLLKVAGNHGQPVDNTRAKSFSSRANTLGKQERSGFCRAASAPRISIFKCWNSGHILCQDGNSEHIDLSAISTNFPKDDPGTLVLSRRYMEREF